MASDPDVDGMPVAEPMSDRLQELYDQHVARISFWAKIESKREAMAEAVLIVLDTREFPLNEQVRDRVLREPSFLHLRTWLSQAVTAEAPEDIFGLERQICRFPDWVPRDRDFIT
ncbi:hypothetical protein [Thermomonospora umbrina]|uniref:Uncharacterized protein n=1 Tax=Thermomonospora umbrina TaxID=111806 RepID=A0A3D9T1F7_9ACTN|nr:hypothetical protein [Thermomonospora umbrina]REE97661.1 hypothetical protein DFJ69_3135 [Thermomonospora umbrina]